MNEKAKTVHEVAKLTGITARTLHYYDEIGLLKPSIITEAKYRQYTDDDLTRLQEILFFREVGFALKEIKELLDSPHYVRSEASCTDFGSSERTNRSFDFTCKRHNQRK